VTARCGDLDPFFDQELDREAARAFREHLATCERCQRVLRGRMLEAVMVADAQIERRPRGPLTTAAAIACSVAPDVPRARAILPAPRSIWHRRAITFGAAVTVVTAVAVAVVPVTRRTPPRVPLALALADQRSTEVRFSAVALDHHRPYEVVRGASSSHEQIKLAELAELEHRGDLHTLLGAFALNGDLVSADRTAGELSARQPRPTAPTLTDRAAIELLRTTTTDETSTVASERALSLTADALRIEPASPQAQWNRALALRRLGLALLAARAFDDVAALHEAGWADEARSSAEQLRRGYQRSVEDWRRRKAAADLMVLGGPPLTEDAVAAVPSLARDAFYKAVATAATPDRLDALANLARALDSQFATTALADLLARVRASDLRARAPLAAELKAILDHQKPSDAIDELRAHALKHDARDIALASFLVIDASETTDDDLVLFDQVLAHSRDPWWTLVRLARRAHVIEFVHRDDAAVDATARLAAPICATIRSAWCGRIARLAGGANSEMGRADLATEQLAAARRQARDAALPEDEIAAIEAIGQAIAIRVTDEVDSSTVAGAYLEEAALRHSSCEARLLRLDFAANAALLHHRFAQAAQARHDADVLEQERCQEVDLRLNGETARVRLVLHGDASTDSLRDHLARLRRQGSSNQSVYVNALLAAAALADKRPEGAPALRQVIDTTSADPSLPYAEQSRALAFDALVESVAAAGDAKAVLALLTERLGAPGASRCVVGAASWNRLVVAALDAEGRPALELRDIPDGAVMIPSTEVVPPALRARLARCRRVHVVTPGAYFGAPGLLGDDVAWVYRHGAPRTAAPSGPPHELVVSEATPPGDLRLAVLQPFAGGAEADTVLSGADATPVNVLAAMAPATLVVIVAHGLTDASEPSAASLVLSPDAQADYLLTASKVRTARLTRSPTVVLAGCDAGRVQVSARPWSLATSFLQAGARVVIAPTAPIPDASANEVFRSLVERIRQGADPADALVAERRGRPVAAWLSSIVVFE
jgi:hypothetical protein